MAAPCCSLVLIPLQADGYLEVLGEGPGREKSTRLSKLDLPSFTCSQELTFSFLCLLLPWWAPVLSPFCSFPKGDMAATLFLKCPRCLIAVGDFCLLYNTGKSTLPPHVRPCAFRQTPSPSSDTSYLLSHPHAWLRPHQCWVTGLCPGSQR